MDYSRSLDGKRVLMVLAHCDDELICGWPILQNPNLKKSLLIISSDRYNTDRTWCSHRKFVTRDLCKLLGINVCILDYNSDFYRLNHRDGKLAKAEQEILTKIKKSSFDWLFTHNPHGEYGHLDHVFLFNLLFRTVNEKLLISDITIRSDWTKIKPESARYADAYFSKKIDTVLLDKSFYRKVMRFYETRGVWTWSQKPVSKSNLYRI